MGKSSSDKPCFAESAHEMAAAINFESGPFPFPWPFRYRCIEPSPGGRLILEEDNDLTLQELPIRHLVNRLVWWSRLNQMAELYLTVKKAIEVADLWLSIADPIPMKHIKSVRWLTEPGYTWRRLPWDKGDGPCPTWDKLLGRLTNQKAFCAWVGSLFFEEAKQHQYVWCHGRGNDGKGAINRFLKRVFGRAYRSKQPPGKDDKFWTYGLIGSRVVVFPDCNSQGFTTGGFFKSLSGGDPIDAEAKGKMSFTIELGCKFLFFSNERPNVTSEHADMRRIIYCEFTEKGEKEAGFEDRLWEEGGAFLSRCVNEYIAAYPDHSDIQSDREEIETWVSAVEERFQTLFDEHLFFPNELYRTTDGLKGLSRAQIDLVTIDGLWLEQLLVEKYKERRDQYAFRDWMYKKYSIRRKPIKRDGDVFYRYVGAAKKLTSGGVNQAKSRLLNILD